MVAPIWKDKNNFINLNVSDLVTRPVVPTTNPNYVPDNGSGGSGSGGGNNSGNNDYMTIEALENGLQVKLSGNTISYSLNKGTSWVELASNTYTPAINSGKSIIFKGDLNPTSSNGIGRFSITKKCKLSGNCNSLLFDKTAGDNNSLEGYDNAFRCLFSGCTNIASVSETFLPATTLASSCYSNMFQGCTGLTTAPELPATTLASSCYSDMFQGCTSLEKAPNLPAINLANGCYNFMFSKCSGLTTAPELPATTLASSCYSYMFENCTKLTIAPDLPAPFLKSGCYDGMFFGCTSLEKIKMLAINISPTSCLDKWVNGVASAGIFIKHPDMTSLLTGISGIPSGWDVKTYETLSEDIKNSDITIIDLCSIVELSRTKTGSTVCEMTVALNFSYQSSMVLHNWYEGKIVFVNNIESDNIESDNTTLNIIVVSYNDTNSKAITFTLEKGSIKELRFYFKFEKLNPINNSDYFYYDGTIKYVGGQ